MAPGKSKKPETFGKYQVEDLIAEGGMAEVFLAATPPPVVRRVAVKRIKPLHAAEQGFLEMFEDEARVAACFDHPNVVRVLDFEPGPPPYLVMEHVDGPDLRRLFWEAATKQQWMPVHIAAAIVAQAARGLHYAHTWKDPEGTHLQVIHRDMSPQNIMLTTAGAVKVLDFGIAKAAGRNTKTQAGIIKGKYAYMAPEQVRGGKLSPRTDVFALGIILFEAVTYKNPFRKDRDELTLIAVSDEAPEAPKSLRPDLPDDLEEIILKALEKDPEQRFQSAVAFAEAIDASISSRRKAVTQAHIADFLSGIAALPMPGEAEAPVSEADKEVSEADVRRASQVMSTDEIAKAVAAVEAQKAAEAAEASAEAREAEPTHEGAEAAEEAGAAQAPGPGSTEPVDVRAAGMNEEDGDTGTTQNSETGESTGGDEALLDKSTRIQEKFELPQEDPDDGDYAVDGPLRPLTMPSTPAATMPKKHRDEHLPAIGETPAPSPVPELESAPAATDDGALQEKATRLQEKYEMPEPAPAAGPAPTGDEALQEKATRLQEKYEMPEPEPEPGLDEAVTGDRPPVPRVAQVDSIRGSYPQALPPDWKLPVMIVIGLAVLGGVLGAALAFLAG